MVAVTSIRPETVNFHRAGFEPKAREYSILEFSTGSKLGGVATKASYDVSFHNEPAGKIEKSQGKIHGFDNVEAAMAAATFRDQFSNLSSNSISAAMIKGQSQEISLS